MRASPPRAAHGPTVPALGGGTGREGPGSRQGIAASDRGAAAQGLLRTPARRGRVGHLCVASANCARWKSAASRLISSQASAMAALLAETPGNRRHVSPQAAGAEEGRAARRDKTPPPTQAPAPRRGWGGAGSAVAPPTPRGGAVPAPPRPPGLLGARRQGPREAAGGMQKGPR